MHREGSRFVFFITLYEKREGIPFLLQRAVSDSLDVDSGEFSLFSANRCLILLIPIHFDVLNQRPVYAPILLRPFIFPFIIDCKIAIPRGRI